MSADPESGHRQSRGQLLGQRFRERTGSVNPNRPEGSAPRLGQLPQGDPDFAGHAVGIQDRLAGGVFVHPFERPQGHNAASSGDLESHRTRAGTQIQGDDSLRGRIRRCLQLADVRRNADELEPRRAHQAFQSRQASLGQGGQGHPLASLNPGAPGIGYLQSGGIGMKSFLRLQLEEAFGIGIGQDRNFGLGDQEAGDRQSHRTGTLPDSGLIQLGPQLPAQGLRITRIDIHRQFGPKIGGFLEPGRGAPQKGPLDTPTFPRKPQDGLGSFTGTGSQFEEMDHAVFWAFTY